MQHLLEFYMLDGGENQAFWLIGNVTFNFP